MKKLLAVLMAMVIFVGVTGIIGCGAETTKPKTPETKDKEKDKPKEKDAK